MIQEYDPKPLSDCVGFTVQSSSNGAGISPLPGFGGSCFLTLRAHTRRAHGLGQPSEAQPENAVGKAVYDTVTEAVAYSQPGGQEGQRGAVQDPGAFQKKVNDVGQPQHIEHAGYPKQNHGVAPVGAVPGLARGVRLVAGEAGPPVVHLFGVLPADFENVEVSEADDEGSRGVK